MEAPETFEMQRRVAGVRLKELKLLVRKNAHRLWQGLVASPEARRRVVIQSFREGPARGFARAASAAASSFPALPRPLKLLVPRSRVEGGEPLPEGCQLLGRQAPNLPFKLLDLGHGLEYKGSLIVRLTDRA